MNTVYKEFETETRRIELAYDETATEYGIEYYGNFRPLTVALYEDSTLSECQSFNTDAEFVPYHARGHRDLTAGLRAIDKGYYSKNASGKVYAEEVFGIHAVMCYDLFWSELADRRSFYDPEDFFEWRPWLQRALDRAAAYVRKHYHYSAVSRGQHSASWYSIGIQSGWDEGVAGFAYAPKDKLPKESAFDNLLNDYIFTLQHLMNGEVYELREYEKDAHGDWDCIDCFGGLLGWEVASEEFDVWVAKLQ